MHTRDILTVEKQMHNVKLSKLKSENQNMGRQITKDKYHNKREEEVKKKKRDLDDIKDEIEKLGDTVLTE